MKRREVCDICDVIQSDLRRHLNTHGLSKTETDKMLYRIRKRKPNNNNAKFSESLSQIREAIEYEPLLKSLNSKDLCIIKSIRRCLLNFVNKRKKLV